MTPSRYPRDMAGYGRTPPDPRWPGGARVALQIVVNYEEGGENNLLHGDPASEAFLSETIGAAPWPGQRNWNMESIYEYGSRAGFWRLWRMMRHLPVTVYGVASALARSPEQVAAMQEADWEIASHGLKWIEYKDMGAEEEAQQMAEAIRLHTEVTGAAPRGWYTGRCSMQTVRLAAETGGFDYIADSYADDLPFWVDAGGRDQLIVPYTLDANDMRFATAQGFNSGDQFYGYLRDTFDMLAAEGGRMMSVGLHCRLAGRPGRALALQRFLEHVERSGVAWIATRAEIARHWAREHPHRRDDRPSAMDEDTFVTRFGGVYEGSPWIAARAWRLELGPAHDSAQGLHSAMARAFRSATPEERLGVLRAHPDLAGTLAAARNLTVESSAEQASAGLDALTDDERARFTALNDAYRARFGFPFIIAVRDHDKPGILAAFAHRLQNDETEEIATACGQVERIAALRLGAMLP